MIHTIGHGNRSAEAFVSLLKTAGIDMLVDVRAHPASKRHPQFGRPALESSLAQAGIGYVWEGKRLGGFRKPHPDSSHVALAVDGFRGYADHMQTAEFAAAMQGLVALAEKRRVAIMCAEKHPDECHRSFISDWLGTHGVAVMHLIGPDGHRAHRINDLARIADGRLIYDRLAQGMLFP